MGTVIVDDYIISTSADANTATALLGKAWTANGLRARIGNIQDLGNNTYRMNAPLNGMFDVKVTASGRGSVIETKIRRTRITQPKLLLLIPLGPKKVHVNGLVRNVIGNVLPQYLAAEGYEVTSEARSHPLR